MQIHSTALIHSTAQLYDDVIIGPFAFIGPHVTIGKQCIIDHHATVDGYTTMGQNNMIHPYCFLGAQTHDLKYKGGTCHLKIGNNNVFREYVSIHTATNDGEATSIGDHNYVLAFSHIGHDCILGHHIIISAQTVLGGHVRVGHHANIGGNAAIHQFCRIGDYAMLGGHSFLKKDLLPFILACGAPASAKSFNRIGMLRKGFSEEERTLVKQIFKCVYESELNRSQAAEQILKSTRIVQFPEIYHTFFNFVHAPSLRGLV